MIVRTNIGGSYRGTVAKNNGWWEDAERRQMRKPIRPATPRVGPIAATIAETVNRTPFVLTLIFALAVAPLAAAHDFWIEPSTFHPSVGDRVGLSLRVGQKVNGDPVPRIPPLIDRFL